MHWFIIESFTFLWELRLAAVITLQLDDGGHVDGEHSVGILALTHWAHISPSSAISWLAIGTSNLGYSKFN